MNSNSLDTFPRTLYFSSSRGIGFTYHLSELACRIGGDKNFLFVSGEREQFPGIFIKLDNSQVNRTTIPSLDTSKKLWEHLQKLITIIKTFKPEVIHTQTNYQLLLISLLKPFYKFKIIQTIHAFDNGAGGIKMRLTKSYITSMCALFTDRVFFQSSFVKNNFKLLSRKSYNLAMGFETPESTQTKSFSLPLKIVYAAKFHKAKNHIWLIEALEPLLLENLVTLTLPGNGDSFESVKLLTSQKDLSDKVILPGWANRETISKIYDEAHLAIVPSSSETLGYNIIEPLAYGIPVISFPVGIAPDIAEKSNSVTLVNFYAAEEIINIIKKYIHNSEDYNKTSLEAYDYFQKNLTWEIHIKKYKSFLIHLINPN